MWNSSKWDVPLPLIRGPSASRCYENSNENNESVIAEGDQWYPEQLMKLSPPCPATVCKQRAG